MSANVVHKLVDEQMEKIDLTHPMGNGMPVWPTHPPFRQTGLDSFEAGNIACNHLVEFSEHCGTHLDAPRHFVPTGTSIADIGIDLLFGRMVCLDVSDQSPDSEVSLEKILSFEAQNGRIQPGDAALFYFGWEHFWGHPRDGAKFFADWPGLSEGAAVLLTERGIRLAACDCLSLDRFGSPDYPVHRQLLGNGIMIGENFCNLSLLPPVAWLATLPLPIQEGSGSPVRAVAFLP